jgi:peptide/nickel transport system permease protein
VLDRVAPTIEVLTIALVVALLAGAGLAALSRSAIRLREEGALGAAALISALPIALTLVLIIVVPSYYWHYSYPVGGYVSPFDDLRHNMRLLGPPSVTIGLALCAVAMMVMRRPGFASPISPRAVAAAACWLLPLLLTGVVLTERMFSINGLGYMLFGSAFIVDLAAVQALASIVITLGVAYVLFARLSVKPSSASARNGLNRAKVRSSPMLLVGCAIVFTAIVAAAIGPELRSGGRELNGALRFAGPSLSHPFGATRFGQDLLDQVLSATRGALVFAGAVVVATFVPGVIVGTAATRLPRRWASLVEGTPAYLASVPVMALLFVLLPGGFFIDALRDQLRVEVVSVGILALAIGLSAGSHISFDSRDPGRSIRFAAPVLLEGLCWVVAVALLFQASVRFLFDFDSVQLKWTFGGLINEGSSRATEYPHLLLAPGLTLTLIVFGFLLIAVRLAAWRQDAEQAALEADR